MSAASLNKISDLTLAYSDVIAADVKNNHTFFRFIISQQF